MMRDGADVCCKRQHVLFLLEETLFHPAGTRVYSLGMAVEHSSSGTHIQSAALACCPPESSETACISLNLTACHQCNVLEPHIK